MTYCLQPTTYVVRGKVMFSQVDVGGGESRPVPPSDYEPSDPPIPAWLGLV